MKLFWISLLITLPALGWGPTGHRAAGEIAQRHLTPQAAAAVQELLGGETLAMVSTWADLVRGADEWKHTATWHYVTIPDGETYESSTKEAKGDVISAMEQMEAKLRDPNVAKSDKADALKFLVHFIADVHQPLHVGRAGDRGGNTITLRWMREAEPVTLHAVWDTLLLDEDRLSYTELTTWIDRAPEPEIEKWQQAAYLDYVRESQQLRDSCYDFDPQQTQSYAYLDRHLPTVHRRILQAGIRIAGRLNAIFASTKIATPQ